MISILSVQLNSLSLAYVTISNIGVAVLAQLLTAPRLQSLKLDNCTISCNDDYSWFAEAIICSSLKNFTYKDIADIDETLAEARSEAVKRILKHSKTLEEVMILENDISSEVVKPLVEAMNNSRVKKLTLGRMGKHNISEITTDLSIPSDRVVFV